VGVREVEVVGGGVVVGVVHVSVVGPSGHVGDGDCLVSSGVGLGRGTISRGDHGCLRVVGIGRGILSPIQGSRCFNLGSFVRRDLCSHYVGVGIIAVVGLGGVGWCG